jgi:hypothetical protein
MNADLRAALARHTKAEICAECGEEPKHHFLRHDFVSREIAVCADCRKSFPCDAARALAALDEAEDHRTRCHNFDPDAVIAHLTARADTLAAQNAALVEACNEVLAADGAIARQEPGADQRWDVALAALDAASDTPASDAWLAEHDAKVRAALRERLLENAG